jgi:hypothetical protein
VDLGVIGSNPIASTSESPLFNLRSLFEHVECPNRDQVFLDLPPRRPDAVARPSYRGIVALSSVDQVDAVDHVCDLPFMSGIIVACIVPILINDMENQAVTRSFEDVRVV